MAGIGTNYALSRAPTAVVGAGAQSFQDRMAPPADLSKLDVATPNERPEWARRSGIYKTGLAGFGQRVGDALDEPGMSAAMMRGAGAAFNGEGLGGVIKAASGYMDDRHATEAKAGQQQFDNGLAELRAFMEQHRARADENYQHGQLVLGADRLAEEGRSNRARESIDANGQRVQLHGIDTGAATTQRGQDLDYSSAGRRIAQDDVNSQRDYAKSIYGDDTNAYIASVKPAGVGGGYAYTQTKTRTPASNPSFGPAVPASETITRTPLLMAPKPTATPRLQRGAVVDGMTYLGGNPNDRASWR